MCLRLGNYIVTESDVPTDTLSYRICWHYRNLGIVKGVGTGWGGGGAPAPLGIVV